MSSECVKVIVRCRPMNTKEKNLQCAKIIKIDQRVLQVTITKPRILGSELAAGKAPPVIKDDNAGEFEPKSFTFDGVYDDDSTQREVYEDAALPLLQSVLEGYNGTIFAYGQTGCGKTFTMEGVRGVPELRGIIPTTFASVFESINQNAAPGRQFLVRASYLEIYNEEVRDLTSDNPKARCDIKEDKEKGVYVKGLVSAEVKCEADLEALMARGNANRTVGATLMNADSSRSHSIFCITVECSEPDTAKGGDEVKIKQGKLNLVDLAGSERQSKTQAEGVRLKEATKINLSLSALGNVIEALVANASGKARHIPYRDSKLTRLLQDSLGGNTKTIMIAAISPADYNFDETLSTLRYANRAKNIKNKPKVNEDPKDALLREYQDEIKRLKMILEEKGLGDLLAAVPGAKPAAAAPKLALKAPAPAATKSTAASLSPNTSPRPEPSSARSDMSTSDELSPDSVAVAAALSGTEIVEREAELAEDLDRLADEKHHHEHLAAVIEMELATRDEAAVQLEAEKKEIDERIASESAAGKSEVVALLEAEKARLEADQIAQANETAALKQSMAAEKAEHEARAAELAKQMEEKLAEESARRQEIEQKLTFIKQKTVKEKEALKAKLALLQQKLISGHERIKDIKNEQEEQMRAMKERERALRAEQAQLEQERRQKEEQNLLIEEQYANKEAELTNTREKLSKLQRRYRALAAEKDELEDVLENEKAQSNNQIRELERESRLYQMIVQKLLTNTDLDLIVRQAYYDESRDTWQLPHIEMPMVFPTVTVSSQAANNMPQQAQENDRYQSKSNATSTASSFASRQMMPWKRDELQPNGTPGSSVLDRLRSRSYRDAIDRQPSAYVERVGPAGWKRSVLATMSTAELEAMANDPRSRADPRYLTRTPKQMSPAEARAAAVAVSENIEAITANAKRRDAFKPQEEVKEAPQTIDIQELDAQVKKRPAFQPAKINSPGTTISTQPLPESAFNVPSRPAFQPAGQLTQPTSPSLDLDSLPKGRPAFAPAGR